MWVERAGFPAHRATGANNAPNIRLAIGAEWYCVSCSFSRDSSRCPSIQVASRIFHGILSELEHDLHEHRVSLQAGSCVELVEPLEVSHEVHVAILRSLA